jgi:hypothetical protein
MKTLLEFRRHVERRWAEKIQSTRQIHRQIVVAAGRAMQRTFNDDRSLIPVPVRVVNRRPFDRVRSRD